MDIGLIMEFGIDTYRPMVYNMNMTPEELKAWRKDNGFSQGKLAKALSVDPMSVSRWERGVREIPSFLHLALKWLEYEGGEKSILTKGKKTRKEKER